MFTLNPSAIMGLWAVPATGTKPVLITGTRSPIMSRTFFVFLSGIICLIYKINPFSQNPRLSATKRQSFQFSVNIIFLAPSTLAAGVGGGTIFLTGPGPPFGDPVCRGRNK